VRIALVSEGPSARDYPGPDGYDEVVGANGVPSLWRCTWWVFMDPEMYLHWMNMTIGRPNILCPRRMEGEVSGTFKAKGLQERWKEDLASGRVVYEDQVPPVPPMPMCIPILQAGNMKGSARWDQYTGLACLTCCWFLADRAGVTADVDVYGVDLDGIGDCHEREGAPARTADRWIVERRLFQGLVDGFRASGDLKINWPQEKRNGDRT